MSQVETLPGGLGATLRERRVARGVSREDMARATRIGLSYLDALEGDRLGELPAPVFVRGFVRAYCAHLGEPADEHLRRLRLLLGEPPDAAPVPAPRRGRRDPRLGPIAVSAILVALVGTGLLAVTQLGRLHRPERDPVAIVPAPDPPPAPDAAVSPAPAAPAPPPATAGPPVGATPAPGPAPGAVSQPDRPLPASPPAQTPPPAATTSVERFRAFGSGPLKLTGKAVERTWVRVQTDRGRVEEELEPGAVREWRSEGPFTVTVGNAAGLELTFNDRPMPPLGGRGVVRKLEIPAPAAGARQ
jgi:cytoskeleton protein RodZ